MDVPEANQLAALISELILSTQEFVNQTTQLLQNTPYVHLITEQISTLRLRTRKGELIITPEENYTLVVQQTSQKGLTDKSKTLLSAAQEQPTEKTTEGEAGEEGEKAEADVEKQE